MVQTPSSKVLPKELSELHFPCNPREPAHVICQPSQGLLKQSHLSVCTAGFHQQPLRLNCHFIQHYMVFFLLFVSLCIFYPSCLQHVCLFWRCLSAMWVFFCRIKSCLFQNKLLCVGSSLRPCLRTALFDKPEVCVILSSPFFFLLRVILGVSTAQNGTKKESKYAT